MTPLPGAGGGASDALLVGAIGGARLAGSATAWLAGGAAAA